MKTWNVRIIELDERDVRLSAINGGLTVELSPNTEQVTIRTVTMIGWEQNREPLDAR